MHYFMTVGVYFIESFFFKKKEEPGEPGWLINHSCHSWVVVSEWRHSGRQRRRVGDTGRVGLDRMLLAPALACDVSREAVGQSGTVTITANRRRFRL
jgi:hypothetical protein